MAPILVTPSTTWAISGPKSSAMRSGRRQRVFDDVVEKPGGDRHDVELHVGEEVGDLERMDQIRLAGMAHLALVLERGEHVRPPQQLEVGFRAVAPDFLEEGLESNHERRCLTLQGVASETHVVCLLHDSRCRCAGACRGAGFASRTAPEHGAACGTANALTGPKTAHYTGALTRAWTAPRVRWESSGGNTMRKFSSRAAVVALIAALRSWPAAAARSACSRPRWRSRTRIQLYQQQDYKAAAAKYEEALAARSRPMTDLRLLFLGNSYDNLYRPAKKGDATNDAYADQGGRELQEGGRGRARPEDQAAVARVPGQRLHGPDKLNDPSQAEPMLLQHDPDGSERADATTSCCPTSTRRPATTSAPSSSCSRRARRSRTTRRSTCTLAGFYNRQGDFDKTMEALQERTKQEPNNPEAFYTLATYYWEKAYRDFTTAGAPTRSSYVAGRASRRSTRRIELKRDYIEALTYKNLLLRVAGEPREESGQAAGAAEGSRPVPRQGRRRSGTSSAPLPAPAK